MEFRQMQYFVALYEEQSITKAGRRLHVVQPAVSMQIRRLETDYGVDLFERTAQGVYPNAIAQRLYPLCVEVLQKVDLIHNRLKEASGRIAGKLTVGIQPSVAQGTLSRVLVEFQQQNPEIRLTIQEGYTANLADRLFQGDLDFAVMTMLEDDARLRYQSLATEEMLVVTSAQTPLTGTVMTGADLHGLNLVLPSQKNLNRILIDTEFERAGLELTPAMEVDSLSTVLGILHNPGWASILSASAVSSFDQHCGLVCLPLIEPVIRRRLVVAFQPRRKASPAARLLIGRLEAALRQQTFEPKALAIGLA